MPCSSQGDPGEGPLQGYDNRALAARHAPRLNRFLAAVHDAAAAALGGTWSHEATGVETAPRWSRMAES